MKFKRSLATLLGVLAFGAVLIAQSSPYTLAVQARDACAAVALSNNATNRARLATCKSLTQQLVTLLTPVTPPPPPPPPADTTPPTAPSSVTVVPGTTTLTVTWTPSTDDTAVVGYHTYLDGPLTGTLTTPSAVFGGLACETAHQIGIDAFDAAGNISARTSVSATLGTCAAPPPPPPPPPPTTLLFSTTFDCAPWNQKTFLDPCQSGDPIWKNGDWLTSNGSGEELTAAANYPGGGGGLGQRHWIGQSSGNTNGSGGTWWRFSSRQEVWLRLMVRWEAGLKLGGNATPIARNHKILYYAGGGCGQSSGCYFDIAGGNYRFVIAGNPYTGGSGWDGLFGGSNAASDGRWILMEFHLKNATSGANGIAEWWIDGVQVLKLTSVDMKGSTGFSEFELPSNHQFTTVNGACCDMYEDFDDVAIGTTGRIGPVVAPSPAPAPAPAPATVILASKGR